MREDMLYTPEEIAQRLKLSKYTIYEMIKRGEIPSHRIGRSLRVSESQYEAYLMDSRQSGNSFEAEVTTDSDGEKVAVIKGNTKDVEIIVSTDLEGSVRAEIKPESIILSRNALECSARNSIEGVITGLEEVDSGYKIIVNIGIPLTVSVSKKSVTNLGLKLGDTVYTVFKAMSVIIV